MTWSEAFGALFVLIGLAFIYNGFPNIKIGGTHNYYECKDPHENEEENEDLDEED